MTKQIKSLKRLVRYSDMLARESSEIGITNIPLKKDQTMEITNLKLSIHNSKKIIMSVSMGDIRSISPLQKDKIRVQYYEPKQLRNGTVMYNRKYSDFKLHKNDVSATHICRKIQQEHERLNTKTANQYGFLMVHGWEHIVDVYHKTKTNKGDGLFYVTNMGVALETDEGITFDVPFEHVKMVTTHKKKIRVIWMEPWHWNDNYQFDFEMDKKTDTDVVLTQINTAFSQYRKKIGYAYMELEKKYGNCTYDEMFNLVETRNPEFQKYIEAHAKHTFGYLSPFFSDNDGEGIVVCKLAGVDIDVIKDIPEHEAIQRKESLDFFAKMNEYNKKYKAMYDVQLEMESQCKDKDAFAKLQKNKEYKKILEKLDELEKNHGLPGIDTVSDFEDARLRHGAKALQMTDSRTLRIYKKWAENFPLVNGIDEYDDSWMNYLMEQLNCEHGKTRVFGGSIDFDTLREEMKLRDRNITTLTSFVAPDGVADEDIFNNCWHDRIKKIWYVYDDNLPERLQNQAISDPDHSQGMIGRRVWGFGEDQVMMYHGFPSIQMECSLNEDILIPITVSRDTGKRIEYLKTKNRHFILPILKEGDIVMELMDQFGKFICQTEAMQYSIESSGGRNWMTPKMQNLWCEKWDLAIIPINERARRALFTSKTTMGWFNAKSRVTIDDV